MERAAISSEIAGRPERHRVSLVVGQLRRGGLEKQVFLLATGLDRSRFDVRVVSLSRGGAWAEALASAGVGVTQLERHGRLSLRRLLGLLRHFRRSRPDLVYSFNYETNAYGRIAGLLASVPILMTGERGIYMNRWQGCLERILMTFTECIVCNAEATRQDLISRFSLPPEKVVTIRNAVEPEPPGSPEERRAARRILGASENDCVVGTIARLDAIKNLPMLIEAAALCGKARWPLRFCVVGGGREEGALRLRIRARGLEDTFLLIGERESARQLLKGFDLFVLTSRSEGLPNVVMEAMASGLPCICTDVGGCRELVDDGETGYLVPPGDAEALAARVLDLARDPGARARMGGAGRWKIEREFPVKALVSRTEELLTSLLAARPRAARGRRMSAHLVDPVE